MTPKQLYLYQEHMNRVIAEDLFIKERRRSEINKQLYLQKMYSERSKPEGQ